MENNKANSNGETIENANANSLNDNKGTQENGNSTNQSVDTVASTIDYQKKFSESSKEANRLLELHKEKDAEIERLRTELMLKDSVQDDIPIQNTDNLDPFLDNMDEDSRNQIIAYTNTVTKRATEQLMKDPVYAFAKRQYNEQFFDSGLNKIIEKYPDLLSSKDEFKSKYFNANNVPENIVEILDTLAKGYLFDKAKDIGAKEVTEMNNRAELERTTAGVKESKATRTLEDWQRMSVENPNEFRKLSSEFNDDINSGRI